MATARKSATQRLNQVKQEQNMPQTIAAVKGRFGDTEYYVFTMKAAELVRNVTIPRDMPNWVNLSVTEIYQRDINIRRVREIIAPYFLQDSSRFIGSLIITAINENKNEKAFSFERLSDALGSAGFNKLHVAYKEPADAFGFLTINSSTRLVPLDGQHRLQGIKYAINGQDDTGRVIPGGGSGAEIAAEDVTLIMVEYHPERARRIFTKVNMYAKKPTTGQTIITDDDNYIAEFSRVIANKIGGRLVKIQGNTLRDSDNHFTTLSTIFNCNLIILNAIYPVRIKGDERIDSGKKDQYKEKLEEIWDVLIKNIQVFKDCLNNREETGDARRHEIRKKNLLGKPVGQEIMIRAFMRLIGPETNMSWSEACRRLNLIPWSIEKTNIESRWQNVVWQGDEKRGRIITKNRTIAERLVAYWAGEKLSPEQIVELEQDYLNFFLDKDNRALPDPIV